MARRLVLVVALAACGSKGPPPEPPKPPEPKPEVKPPPPPAETEEDREKKRKDAALAIIPDGSTCLPLSLKDANAPRLELAAIGAEAVVCAMDTERLRLLGPIGCWKVDLGNGNLGATQPSPLPGRGFDVKLDDRCARGYCLPKDAKLPGEKVAHIAYNLDSTKAAVLIGDEVHIYDAKTKEHASSFSIRGDKGVTNDPTEVHWVGDAIFVEGADSGSPFSAVWVFKTDGTQVGPIEPLGGAKDAKPISTNGGSFNILDEHRVGLAELGFTTLTEYDIATAKRTKLVRTIKKGPCKKDEEENFWKDNVDALSPKCKDYMTKTYAHLVGATGISGKTNLLILLRGPRLGELAVLDAHTLAEKKTIKMTWCQAADAAPSASAP